MPKFYLTKDGDLITPTGIGKGYKSLITKEKTKNPFTGKEQETMKQNHYKCGNKRINQKGVLWNTITGHATCVEHPSLSRSE